MTLKRAREIMGLKETDALHKDGIKALIESNEKQLKTWSVSGHNRRALEEEAQALKILYKAAI